MVWVGPPLSASGPRFSPSRLVRTMLPPVPPAIPPERGPVRLSVPVTSPAPPPPMSPAEPTFPATIVSVSVTAPDDL